MAGYSAIYAEFLPFDLWPKCTSHKEGQIPIPQKGLEFPGGGGFRKTKNFKECMKLNWKNSLPWGRYGFFLELHNLLDSSRMTNCYLQACHDISLS